MQQTNKQTSKVYIKVVVKLATLVEGDPKAPFSMYMNI